MKSKLWQQVFQYALGALVVLGLYFIIAGLLAIEIPEQNRDAMMILLGVAGGQFANVVGYFYGSSKGSSDKNELMSNKPEKPE